ncbi:het domain-containing protein [Diplodia corticola]|uniref:Het domain-containing protein n=1 Tax=Diplodia corticola TaxID=236234 RepID=A0A1J9QKH9_9PEZI|nr:het domain-containing protein [Diplodia corticola]OJD28977.1 het domain-containing protein [Diplodia corticola]
MRLLNTSTLTLHYFPADPPPYAILSHTWGDQEVTFQEWLAKDRDQAIQMKSGFLKVESFCGKAAEAGYQWAWADTCCIDKSSSAELSESINSMFRWYRSSCACFVYLSDVSDNRIALDSEFAQSRWFTRGWTLQELIAPATVIFYSRDWLHMGTKGDHYRIISYITGIGKRSLLRFQQDRSVSIASRMSWASKRQTTRLEDTAYCLMGIVGVNMPLLYGEGHKAFQRLQEEIMKVSDDQSLLAWTPLEPSPAPDDDARDQICHGYRGVLAETPQQFSPNIRNRRPAAGFHYWRTPYMMTNKGLQIKLPLVPSASHSSTVFHAILDCTTREPSSPDYTVLHGVGVPLVCVSDDGTQFGRVEGWPLRTFDFSRRRTEGLIRQIYIRQHAGLQPWVPAHLLFRRARNDELASSSRSVSGQSVGEVDDPHCEVVRAVTVEVLVLCGVYAFCGCVERLVGGVGLAGEASTKQRRIFEDFRGRSAKEEGPLARYAVL